MGGTNSGSPSLGTASSASSLSLLRKADDLLTVYKRNKDEKSRDEIVSRIQSENWIQSTFATITDSKTSLADLRFLSKLFEKLVDFIITSATLAKAKADFYVFLNAISSAEVLYYGASLWLAYSKLLMPSKEWNDCFTPMEKWFKVSEGQSIVVCLNVWTSFISYAAAKLNTGALREKLLSSFSKPLRSHAVISKLQSPTPIISAYNTLLSAFADKVDDRFEELVICFLRFIVGKPVAVIDHPQNIEEEITKPVNAKEFLATLGLFILRGRSDKSDWGDGRSVGYLVDPRPHRVFDGAMTHALPLLCTVLGPIHTSANSICSCFAGLAQRIETFEDDEVRRKESRFLFMQLRTWIAESAADVKKLETAVCQLFREADLSVHANTISDWPAKIILETLLDKPSARIGEFLELVPGTLGDGLETDSIVLKRTDDINEGSLLKPDFSTTFSFMRLLFKAINHAEEEVDESTLSSCVSAFGHLYEEVQTTVKHEVNCNAATVLFGVLGSVAPPAKTIWSVRMYTAAALHALNFYSFGLEEEKEVCFGSGSEFNVLGDMAPITSFLIPLGEKILSLMDENKVSFLEGVGAPWKEQISQRIAFT
ncbi:unnamed protein product [Heligmosomoides polygyrus]|uniref:Urb2 domain-containing protein n=1 Tax=Heligmosomoides polygyrus TaxID=6339 RepID=A0A183GPS9_HELPZ|nr:unnamed protein product [Heligmosomoides polygyrus]